MFQHLVLTIVGVGQTWKALGIRLGFLSVRVSSINFRLQAHRVCTVSQVMA